LRRSGAESFVSNSHQGDITNKSCIKWHQCKWLNMDDTDKMSDSKCNALNAIGSMVVDVSLKNASSSLTNEAVHETTKKSHAPGETEQNFTIPIPNTDKKVHSGMFVL
jgi:hypothetical protein